MAKVTGPLMSMSASGAFAKSMVFAANKGRNIVRQLVTPANPKTSAQIAVRNKLRVAAAIQKVINRTTQQATAVAMRDEVALRNKAPSGQTWNATVTAEVVGALGAKYTAATTAYAGVTANDWNNAALALSTPYAPLVMPNPNGSGTVTVSAGEQFFRHQHALYTAGVLTSAPTTPPTYA